MVQLEKAKAKEDIETLYLNEEEMVKELLARRRKVKVERDMACGSLELQIAELTEQLRQASSPFDHKGAQIEVEIKKYMPSIAKTVKSGDGAALFRKGSTRVSYDAHALDALEGDIQAVIQPFRKETKVSPSVSIEVY